MKTSLSKFQQIFHSPKMAAILNFQYFFFKNAFISKTILDRAISTKFLTHGTSDEYLTQFSKKFCPSKYGGHFEFFPKIAKHKNACITKTVPDSEFGKKIYP